MDGGRLHNYRMKCIAKEEPICNNGINKDKREDFIW